MSQGNPHEQIADPTPMGAGSGQLASLLDRFLGVLIDGLILIIPAIIVFVVLGFALAVLGSFGTLIAPLIGSLSMLALFIGINYKFLATRGQTIGKTIMKTQILSDNGELIPVNDLIMKRYLPIWVGSSVLNVIPFVGWFAGPVLSLVNACMIFRANRKCLHDEICKSKVISLK